MLQLEENLDEVLPDQMASGEPPSTAMPHDTSCRRGCKHEKQGAGWCRKQDCQYCHDPAHIGQGHSHRGLRRNAAQHRPSGSPPGLALSEPPQATGSSDPQLEVPGHVQQWYIGSPRPIGGSAPGTTLQSAAMAGGSASCPAIGGSPSAAPLPQPPGSPLGVSKQEWESVISASDISTDAGYVFVVPQPGNTSSARQTQLDGAYQGGIEIVSSMTASVEGTACPPMTADDAPTSQQPTPVENGSPGRPGAAPPSRTSPAIGGSSPASPMPEAPCSTLGPSAGETSSAGDNPPQPGTSAGLNKGWVMEGLVPAQRWLPIQFGKVFANGEPTLSIEDGVSDHSESSPGK